MICPKCQSQNVQFMFVEKGSRTARHGTGFGGKVNNAARLTMAVSTVGMSNLVWKKSGGTQRTKNQTQKMAICQDCGKDWKA